MRTLSSHGQCGNCFYGRKKEILPQSAETIKTYLQCRYLYNFNVKAYIYIVREYDSEDDDVTINVNKHLEVQSMWYLLLECQEVTMLSRRQCRCLKNFWHVDASVVSENNEICSCVQVALTQQTTGIGVMLIIRLSLCVIESTCICLKRNDALLVELPRLCSLTEIVL